MELLVDRVRCAGHGVCRALVPHAVDLDEWGYPIVHRPAVDDADPDALAAARRAVAACPALALRLAPTTPAAPGR